MTCFFLQTKKESVSRKLDKQENIVTKNGALFLSY